MATPIKLRGQLAVSLLATTIMLFISLVIYTKQTAADVVTEGNRTEPRGKPMTRSSHVQLTRKPTSWHTEHLGHCGSRKVLTYVRIENDNMVHFFLENR